MSLLLVGLVFCFRFQGHEYWIRDVMNFAEFWHF